MCLRILQECRGQKHLLFRLVSLRAVEKNSETCIDLMSILESCFHVKTFSPAIFLSSNFGVQ